MAVKKKAPFSPPPDLFSRVILCKGTKYLVLHNIKRNRWEFPGGKCDEGESTPDAARREIREEIGIKNLGPLDFVASRSLFMHENYWAGDFWLATKFKGRPRITEPHKFDEMRWVTSEELSTLPQIPCVGVDLAREVDRVHTPRKAATVR